MRQIRNNFFLSAVLAIDVFLQTGQQVIQPVEPALKRGDGRVLPGEGAQEIGSFDLDGLYLGLDGLG